LDDPHIATLSGSLVNSQQRYAAALRNTVRHAARWLDLGCGHQFLPDWIPAHLQLSPPGGQVVVGIDLDEAALRVHPQLELRIMGSVEALPVATESFDAVTANMVVEHVQRPDLLFQEVYRVLKPGGIFLVHTPNRNGYTTALTRAIPSRWRPRLANILQGRDQRDVYPTFYRANTVDALRVIAERHAFVVTDLQTIGSSPQLYRVPIVRNIEECCLRLLRARRLARFRPCILGHFQKPPGVESVLKKR
jgi:SAM-dependent methyltransferase